MREQQHTLPQHLPLPPFINAPVCSSVLHILSPSFFGICPSAAICSHESGVSAHNPLPTYFITSPHEKQPSSPRKKRPVTNLRSNTPPRHRIHSLLIAIIPRLTILLCIPTHSTPEGRIRISRTRVVLSDKVVRCERTGSVEVLRRSVVGNEVARTGHGGGYGSCWIVIVGWTRHTSGFEEMTAVGRKETERSGTSISLPETSNFQAQPTPEPSCRKKWSESPTSGCVIRR